MNKSRQSRQRNTPAAEKPAPNKNLFRPPLKRRPGLFYALLAAFGVWIGVLLALYFVTVYPRRHERSAPEREEPKPAQQTVSR
jgi:hypothetical protein